MNKKQDEKPDLENIDQVANGVQFFRIGIEGFPPKKLVELPIRWVSRKRESSRPLAAMINFLPMDERYRELIQPIMSSLPEIAGEFLSKFQCNLAV